MNDEFGCFLCFIAVFALLGFAWLASAVADARREARRALEMANHDVPTMARQLYETIGALERRVAILEARLGAGAVAERTVSAAEESSFARAATQPTPEAPATQTMPVAPAMQPAPAAAVPEPLPRSPAFDVPATVRHEPAAEDLVPPAAPPEVRVDWEQWIGVRGAAAAGALVLALAGVYFFRYSIEHGLISPTMRVVIGTLTGLGCIAASELRLRHVHAPLAQYLAGAGFAILYLAFWASNAIYHLVPTPVTTLLMIAVTVASCVMAYVRHAAPVAALGLLGGFATPILLSTGEDRPITLFSYLLMLDLGLLVLARRRSWAFLALAALVGTFLYQMSWFGTYLDAPRMWLGVAISAVFAVCFAFLLPRTGSDSAFRWTRLLAVLAPALFALYFGASAKLGANFVPTATLLVVLTAGCAWLSIVETAPLLRTVAATIAIVTALVHFLSVTETERIALQSMGTLIALALVQLAASELSRRRSAEAADALGLDVVLFGGLVFELVRAISDRMVSPYAHLATLAALFLVASLESVRSGRMVRMLPVSVLLVCSVSFFHARHALAPGFPPESVFLGLLVATAILTQLPALAGTRAGHESARFAEHGAGFASAFLVLQLSFAPERTPIANVPYFATVLLLVLLASLVATRRGHGGWTLATVVATTVAHLAQRARLDHDPGETIALLAGLGFCALVVSLCPLLVGSKAREHVATWRAAALAGPSVLLPSLFGYRDAISSDTRGLVPLGLSVFGLITLLVARRFLAVGSPTRQSAFAWAAAASLSLVSIAIPVQLRNEWVTVGWALQGAAVIALWRRIDHPGLKYYALLLFAAAFVRLVLNVEVLHYHPPSGRPVFNWIAYTYLVPMACMLFASSLLGRLEIDRYRAVEQSTFPDGVALLAKTLGLAAIIVGFVFINLTVIDAYAIGRSLELPVDRKPARDLTISLAWALYAVALLAVGMWKKSSGLRKTSLALVLFTCLKVFLYDLGNLRDLYRVASLVGLALALIVISLAYKRFVFRDASETP